MTAGTATGPSDHTTVLAHARLLGERVLNEDMLAAIELAAEYDDVEGRAEFTVPLLTTEDDSDNEIDATELLAGKDDDDEPVPTADASHPARDSAATCSLTECAEHA